MTPEAAVEMFHQPIAIEDGQLYWRAISRFLIAHFPLRIYDDSLMTCTFNIRQTFKGLFLVGSRKARAVGR